MRCVKCDAQGDLTVVTNSDDESFGALCDDHMAEYTFWLDSGLNPEEAFSTTG